MIKCTWRQWPEKWASGDLQNRSCEVQKEGCEVLERLKALNELWNDYALFYLHKPYPTLTESELAQVYTFYPRRIVEMSEDDLLYLKKDLK